MNQSALLRGLLIAAFLQTVPNILATVFTNSTPITINDAQTIGAANPYPAINNVSGLSGTITNVTVTLTGVTHTFPDDMDILLVAPGGQNLLIMSDAGGGNDASNITLTFDDAAAAAILDAGPLTSGTFKPSQYGAGDTFPAPAPALSANTTFAASFNGIAPNGAWMLYVVDDLGVDHGYIKGWSVSITTTGNPVATTFSSGFIFVNDHWGQASSYPSQIFVSGMSPSLTDVNVALLNLSHTNPDDLDILLVAPDGTGMVIMSDAGGATDAVGVNLTIDDAGATVIPDSGPLASGTFRPSNFGTGDNFNDRLSPPVNPATAGSATLASVFNGVNPNGTWSLYVLDDATANTGTIGGGWSLDITAGAIPNGTVPQVGELIISEFRPRASADILDEFIEIYNTTGQAMTVKASDGSAGLAIVRSDGLVQARIPNGTTIPAHGHFLCSTSSYSLSAYPGGNDGVTATTATANAQYSGEMDETLGIALFTSSTTFTLATRLDAFGPAAEANTLYRKGTGYPTLLNDPASATIQLTFFRRYDPVTGLPVDTSNNVADFVFVDTGGTATSAGQKLGAPGPENLNSPIFKGNNLTFSAVDPGCTGVGSAASACGEVRDTTSDPGNNSTLGTLSVRRKITNNSGAPLSRLRFRIIDLSTFPAPSDAADLRVRTSVGNPAANLSGGGTTPILALTLDSPPSQTFAGGGLNSSLSAGTITLAAPLAAGGSINVEFLFGVQQIGAFHFTVIAETLPAAGGILTLSESCCPADITVSNNPNQCGAVVSYALPGGALCEPLVCSPASGSFFPKGSTQVTCTGATSSCAFQVNVLDSQSPNITCPANLTVQAATGQNSAVVSYPAPVPSDNCPGVAAAVCIPASGSSFPLGGTTVNCSAKDAVNNTSNCSFTVNVTPGPTPTASPTATSTPTATATATATASPSPTSTATATATPNPTGLANLSTRLRVETGDNALIGGFIVTGTQPKRIIALATGPSLAQFFSGTLADPVLELYSGSTLLESNDNWIDSVNRQAIVDSQVAPANDRESAIIRTLTANSSQYTAIVRGAGNGIGVGTVQFFDLDRSVDSKLANISTRGLVETGNDILIAGTIVLGQTTQKVIIRAIGPSLGFSGTLQDPTLELRDGNGDLLDSNDNWMDSPNKQAIIDSTIPPTNDAESAIVATLPSGGAQYTAIVRGANDTIGIAVVEIYVLN